MATKSDFIHLTGKRADPKLTISYSVTMSIVLIALMPHVANLDFSVAIRYSVGRSRKEALVFCGGAVHAKRKHGA